jgi:hypothetical protein
MTSVRATCGRGELRAFEQKAAVSDSGYNKSQATRFYSVLTRAS